MGQEIEKRAFSTAGKSSVHRLLIGILPTLQESDLTLEYIVSRALKGNPEIAGHALHLNRRPRAAHMSPKPARYALPC